MSLAAGVRLGPYEVLGLIGAGGMGEVYKARDTRLERTVAIKVLPADLSADLDRRARFEREAKSIAALAHPHICTLYDVGEHADSMFLVMEHLDGDTLAHRLENGPLAIDQALTIATEITDALTAAHRQGIVHRDLKPANVIVTRTGAKLLDFGLAKLAGHGEQAATAHLASGSTRVSLTSEGVIVGTLRYMAPEQVEGKPADARTDVWAVGTVLYEMLTGHPAFDGKSGAGIIAAILDLDPLSLPSLQRSVPAPLNHVLDLCLAKEPDDRWQSVGDLARELRWTLVQLQAERETSRPWTTRGIAGILALAMASAVAGAAAAWFTRAIDRRAPRVARFIVQLPPSDALEVGLRPAIAFAPDGSQFVYAAVRDGISRLFLRRLDRVEPMLLPGTEGAGGPFFSPDGRFVGYFASGKLMKTSVDGGVPTILGEAASGRGAAWAEDGTVLFSAAPGTGLWKVPSAGGPASVVTRLDPAQTERTHRWPDVLPGGEVALITARAGYHASFDQTSIVSVALDGSKRGTVLAQGTQPSYARTGHLIFARAGALHAVRFDPANLTVSGSPVAVLEEVMTDPSTGGVHYSFSDSGALAYVRGQPWIAQRELVQLDRQGHARPVFERLLTYSTPRLSPDGRRLAVTIEAATDDLWVGDIGSQNLVRLTYETGSHIAPVWTPDSQRIAFASNRFGAYNLFWKRADGSDTAERLTDSTHIQFPGSWSQDGASLAFTESDPTTGSDIWVLSLKDRRTAPLVQTRFNEHGPAISPDGRWVAYSSDESGQEEIYVQRFPGPGEKRQVSADGGREPVWSRRGDALFYRAANRFMVVPVSRAETFLAGSVKLVTEGDYARSQMGGAPSFEVSPDGQSLLLVRERRQSTPTAIHVILDWFEELKAKVPVAK